VTPNFATASAGNFDPHVLSSKINFKPFCPGESHLTIITFPHSSKKGDNQEEKISSIKSIYICLPELRKTSPSRRALLLTGLSIEGASLCMPHHFFLRHESIFLSPSGVSLQDMCFFQACCTIFLIE